MKTRTVVALFLTVCLQAWVVKSQMNTYGTPAFCLFNRLDVIQCNYRNPKTTTVPKENEYGVYATRIRPSGAGPPRCIIRRKNHFVRDVEILGNDERVKFVFSPGKRLQPPTPKYGNQQYVLYNIKCPDGYLAFFNITSINLEEKNCFSENKQRNECIDYVNITRPGYGMTESCGTNPGAGNTNQLEEGELIILFKTSQAGRFSGFEANVICFRREDGNQPGCTRPGNSTNIDDTNDNTGRRKRDLDDFHDMWRRRLSRMKRQSASVRFEEISVPHGIDVIYEKRQLSFILREGATEFRKPLGDILLLHTFDANGTSDLFRSEATNGVQSIPLPGPGPLFIVGMYAYFQLFVIDPRGILPNPEEMAAINDLTQAQFSLVTEDNTTRLSEDILNGECINYARLGLPPPKDPECDDNGVRGRRQTTPVDLLSDDDIIMAIMNENACNPVLMTSARSTIQLVMGDNSERLMRLRNSLNTVPPP